MKLILLILALVMVLEAVPSIRFVGPDDLAARMNGDIEITESKVGRYAKKNLKMKVYFLKKNTHLCDKITEPLPEEPFILGGYRGICTFTTKARHAQHAGASGVLLIDNKDEPANSIIMIDDGTGFDIKIPLVMITKEAGKQLEDHFGGSLKGKSMEVELTLTPTAHTNNVAIEFFYEVSDQKFEGIIVDLSAFLTNCKEQIKFKLFPSFERCDYCSARFAKNNCLLHDGIKDYCVFDMKSGSSGIELLIQSLDQLVLMNEFSEEQFFDYLGCKHSQHCTAKLTQRNMDCIYSCLGAANVDAQKLENAVENSFEGGSINSGTKNRYFEEVKVEREKRGNPSWPTLLVDGYRYQGEMTSEAIKEYLIDEIGAPEDFCP